MKNKFLYALFFSFLIITISETTSYAQSQKIINKKQYKQANNYLENNKYQQALKIYTELLSESKYNPELNHKIGVCYSNLPNGKNKSVEFFEKAIRYNKSPRNVTTTQLFDLADAYHQTYNFTKSIATYNKLLERISPRNVEMIKEVNRALSFSKNGAKLIKHPIQIELKNLGEAINSAYSDHSPGVSADEQTIIFTSRRKGTGGKMEVDGQYFEDIYIATKKNGEWIKAKGIKELNTKQHDASIALSPNGTELYIYKANNLVNNRKNVGDIFISKLKNGKWSKPQSLGETINTKYKENDASVSADGKTIYFSSNRPGGFGGMDIYMSQKQADGKWGKAVNLGENINTEYNDDAPFIFYDNKTLYFSSAGHSSMGGLDIFKSELKNGVWQKPKNIGYPINSIDDDIFYKPTIDGKHAYFASHRKGGLGRTDIYLLTVIDDNKLPLYVLKGKVATPKGDAIGNAKIEVFEKESGIKKYHSDINSGAFFFIIEADKNYTVTVTAKGFHSKTQNVTTDKSTEVINSTITLTPLTQEKIDTDTIKAKKNIKAAVIIPSKQVIPAKKTVPAKRSITKKIAQQKYTIQIMALKKNVVHIQYFSNLKNIEMVKCNDGYTRYFYGIYDNESIAKNELPTVLKKGYADAFTRIYITE